VPSTWIVASPKIGGWAWSLEATERIALKQKELVWIRIRHLNPLKLPRNMINVENHVMKEWQEKKFSVHMKRNWVVRFCPLFITLYQCLKFVQFRGKPMSFFDDKRKIPIGKVIATNTALQFGAFHFDMRKIKWIHLFFMMSEIYQTYHRLESLVRELGAPECIYVPNGRCLTGSTVVAFARKLGVQTRIIESGSRNQSFRIFEHSPHFAPDHWEIIEKIPSNEHNQSLAEKFWDERVNGIDKSRAVNWRDNYMDGFLPKGLNQTYVAFFTSSSHEMSPFDEWNGPCGDFNSEIEAVESIVSLARKIGIQVVIRRHPNSISINNQDAEATMWNKFVNNSDILYLGPASRVDSRELIRRASLVLTHVSSIGLEAIYWNKAAYATGPAHWAINDSYRCWTQGELEKNIKHPKSQDKDILTKWGVYLTSFGYEFKIFEKVEGRSALYKSFSVRYR
jgi:hypothetical protein